MTVTEQREKMIEGLAEVKTEVKNLCSLVTAQNGSIKENRTETIKNSKDIIKITWYGRGALGVIGVISIIVGLVAYF